MADKQQEILNAYVKTVVSSPSGREVIWQILGMCGIYANSFDPNPNVCAYMEGKRSVGIELLGMIEEADPLLYPKLQISMNTPNPEPEEEELEDG